jgi:ligand-binding sensor domain-containing protein
VKNCKFSRGDILSGNLVLLLVFILFITSCEKPPEDLKNPQGSDKWTLFNTSTGLSGNQVRGTFCDSKGNMWFAVSGYGAAKYANNNWTYYKTSNSGILSNGVTCIGEDGGGNIIFGTTNGISMLTTSNTWSYYRHPTIILNITCLITDKDKNVWAGTTNQGFLIFEGSSLSQVYYEPYKTVNDIEEDNKGNMWIATENGLLKWDGNTFSLLTTSSGLPDNSVTALFSDSRDRLWIGTYFGRTVSWIDTKGIHQQPLFNDRITEINDICEDAAGNIWFATYTSGLIKYDNVVPYSYKKYNGFPEDDVLTATSDNDGNVWFGLYSKGLSKYSLPLD